MDINIEIAGFSAQTNIPSQMAVVQNRVTASNIFLGLVTLPKTIVTTWLGISLFMEPQYVSTKITKQFPACTEGRLTAVTVDRYVRVRWVLQVVTYNFKFSHGPGSITANTWEDKDGWEYLTSGSGWIDAGGVALMLPTEHGYVNIQRYYTALPPEKCKPSPSATPTAGGSGPPAG
jgi:hypothetical protein